MPKQLVFGLLLLGGVVGCSWSDKYGTHHLVIGIGFGEFTSNTNNPAVQVSESRIAGAELGPGFSGLGLIQHHRVEIAPDLTNNIVIKINSHHGVLSVTNFNPHETFTNILLETNNKQTNKQK